MRLTNIVLGLCMLTGVASSFGDDEVIVQDIMPLTDYTGFKDVIVQEPMPSTENMEFHREFDIKCNTGDKINMKYYKFKTEKDYVISSTREKSENPYMIIIGDKVYLDKDEDKDVDEIIPSEESISIKSCEYLKEFKK